MLTDLHEIWYNNSQEYGEGEVIKVSLGIIRFQELEMLLQVCLIKVLCLSHKIQTTNTFGIYASKIKPK